MIFPSLSWVLLLLSLALCAVGFYKITYFTTVGHGLAVGGLGLCAMVIALSRGKSSLIFLLATLLCLIYGLFQGGFTALAELLRTSHKRSLKSEAENNTPPYISVIYWLGISLAVLLQIAPLWYRAAAGVGKDGIVSWISFIFMLVGVLLILLAGRQASRQKQADSSLPPTQGLYAWIRCPVQLGRIVFSFGLLLQGVGFLSGSQWIVSLLGFGIALCLAILSAFRSDRRIRKKYAFLPEYREYAEDTHILFPLMMSRKINWDTEEEE